MIPILEVAIVAVAAIISAISLKTLGAIKHVGVGKSFWIPVALSGILFAIGSVISVLNVANFSLIATIPMIDEIAQTTRLIALVILLIGVTSYSRQVSKNLSMMPESMRLAEKTFTRTTETEMESETEEVGRETEYEREIPTYQTPAYQTEPQTQETEAPCEPQPLPQREELPIQERLDQREYQVQIPAACRHEFGYLRTLPRNESIPDECLRCTKILDCRHGLSTTLKTQAQPTPTEE